MSVHNFFAGPAILPQEVIKEASESALEYQGKGLSLLEMSHRSKPLVDIFEETEARIASLLGLSDQYKVLFLTGGASSQFFQIPLNILGQNETAGYLDTGTWSKKAIKEAKLYGNIKVLASSAEANYNFIPKLNRESVPTDLRYLHLTSNNTIFGTQLHANPDTDVRIVCDMSSDIFSRPIDHSVYDLIYAGAQKNLGPAGVTLVIVKKDILGKVDRPIPTILDYQTQISKDSTFNTPPVFPIYVSLLTLRWLEKNGGLEAMKVKNEAKSALLYNEIDRNPLFVGTAVKEDRSQMNVCFLLKDDSLNDRFLEASAEANCVGIKGHRSVGGFRASIYNAMPKSSVQVLVDVMKEFTRVNG